MLSLFYTKLKISLFVQTQTFYSILVHMDIYDCFNAISLMLTHATHQIECFCNNDTCINIIINNFYNKII